ncbi:MAG: hypothetical protein MUE85_01095 [Microscillaceae bacterium]|jgi:hypothetical protein|nr:hypothetical protein [Microscillaceae bacterium]
MKIRLKSYGRLSQTLGFFLLLNIAFTACKNDKDEPAPLPTAKVYIAGASQNTTTEWFTTYSWVDSTPTQLGTTGGFSQATDNFVVGNDVYVCGSVYDAETEKFKAVYWKNGVITELTNGINMAFANAIYVSGNDVYVAGNERSGFVRIAKYWKNGVAVALSDENSDALGIFVVGNDVYVSGYNVANSTVTVTARYWKNGQPITLGSSENCYATSIVVVGNDVYTAGYIGTNAQPRAYYWKNTTRFSLGTGNTAAVANAIFVENNDVYVAGYEQANDSNGYQVAKYWKNGSAVNLSSNGQRDAEAKDIVVSLGEVFAVGYVDNNQNQPIITLWKNGVSGNLVTNLASSFNQTNGEATSIVVVREP